MCVFCRSNYDDPFFVLCCVFFHSMTARVALLNHDERVIGEELISGRELGLPFQWGARCFGGPVFCLPVKIALSAREGPRDPR